MKPASRRYFSVFRNARRLYATQVAGKRVEGKPMLAAQDAKVSKLPNGVAVASLENYSPVCRVAVVYNAGPRYEPIDKLGLTHCLRVACNLRSEKSSAFAIARNLQQLGATLSCTTTKEHMIYTMECMRQDIDMCAELLSQVALTPSFKHWELSDIERLTRIDVQQLNHSPHSRLMELLHKAALRDTLGRSLYMSEDRIGSFTPEHLEEFVATHYVTGNMAVAGVGVDHDTLTELVNKMPVREGRKPTVLQKATYYGGVEERIDVSSPLVHAAIVSEAVPLTSKALLAVALISKVLGGHPGLEYSSTQSATKLYKATASAAPDQNFALSSIHSAYSDSGLFGVHAVASPQNIGKVLKSFIDAIRKLNKTGITDPELKRAKQQLKMSLKLEAADDSRLVENMAVEVLVTGKVSQLSSVDKDVDAVTVESMRKVAKKMIHQNPSMAAIGSMVQTPHLNQLL